MPTLVWLLTATTIATLETKHTYRERLSGATFGRRIARAVPYVVINTGMLAHQFSAFTEGLFGALHSEFERTPKAGRTGAAARQAPLRGQGALAVRARRAVLRRLPGRLDRALPGPGLVLAAVGTTYVGACVAFLVYCYGDHAGKVLFVFDRARIAKPRPRCGSPPAPRDSHTRASAASPPASLFVL